MRFTLDKKKAFVFCLSLLTCLFIKAQDVTLSFAGYDAENEKVDLRRVVITNHTKGWSETILWPDTTFTMQNVGGDEEANDKSMTLSLINPNQLNATANLLLGIEEDGDVTLIISQMNGFTVTKSTYWLTSGTYGFRVSLSKPGTFFIIAVHRGHAKSIKLRCNSGGFSDKIEYQGFVEAFNAEPDEPEIPENVPYPFNVGDQMEFVGYATIDSTEQEAQRFALAGAVAQTVILPFVGAPVCEAPADAKAKNSQLIVNPNDFRIALSLSPFSLNQFEDGYRFVVGDRTATTPEELQSIYRDLGSTEMYVRIATKRHKTAEDTTDGEEDSNANVHTFDQAMRLCRIAAALNIPINPEIMCAYTYMDMDGIQAPRFEEYPELYAMQHGKDWSELSLEEICAILEAYGTFLAEEILKTGCTVNNWNLGNESNFGFAGIGMGAKTAVDRKLEKASAMKRYTAAIFNRRYLKNHVWRYEAKTFAAVKRGVLKAYRNLGIDASNVKFSTHIATVVFTARCSAAFFEYMAKNGCPFETAGISYYPSAPAMSLNKKSLLRKTITKINKKCGIPVFIGEFSYPSGKMEGDFAGWNKRLSGYEKDQQGQAEIYRDVIKWGRVHGMAGIRYWAPDYEGWYGMSMFEFSNKVGRAKSILVNHKELINTK